MNPIITPIISTLLTGIAIAAIVAHINIQIKFAEGKTHARTQANRILLRAALVVVASVLLVLFISELFSPLPATRLSLFSILVSFFGLSHACIHICYHHRYMELFEIMVDRIKEASIKAHEKR